MTLGSILEPVSYVFSMVFFEAFNADLSTRLNVSLKLNSRKLTFIFSALVSSAGDREIRMMWDDYPSKALSIGRDVCDYLVAVHTKDTFTFQLSQHPRPLAPKNPANFFKLLPLANLSSSALIGKQTLQNQAHLTCKLISFCFSQAATIWSTNETQCFSYAARQTPRVKLLLVAFLRYFPWCDSDIQYPDRTARRPKKPFISSRLFN